MSVDAVRGRVGAIPVRAGRPGFGWGWLRWVGIALIMVFCLFPFYWLINTSLKTGSDLSSAALAPPHPTLKNYSSIFHNDDFLRALRNSAVLSLVTTAIALAAPVYKLWSDIGLYDRSLSLGLILPDLTFTLPLTIYILTSFFREIPRGLEEAALVDGATRFQSYYRVVIPLAAPGLVTAGLLAFIFVWNEFLFAITLTASANARPVPAAIAFFTGSTQFEIPLGTISAASVVVTVPLIVLVLLFQRRIIAGLTAGAVKG